MCSLNSHFENGISSRKIFLSPSYLIHHKTNIKTDLEWHGTPGIKVITDTEHGVLFPNRNKVTVRDDDMAGAQADWTDKGTSPTGNQKKDLQEKVNRITS